MTAQPLGFVDPWAEVLHPVTEHLEECQDCGAGVDQPCDVDCPSDVDALVVELADADAAADDARAYEDWGWAG